MSKYFDALPCAYIKFDDAGIISEVNKKLVDWLEYSNDELVGKHIETIFTVASKIFYSTHFFPLIKLQSHANEIFLNLKTKSGNDLPTLANAERSPEGGTNFIRCVFVKVEQRQRYEQELLAARRQAESALAENTHLMKLSASLQDQALELERQYRSQRTATETLLQFGKITSHDLHEPIRKILLFADMILNDPATSLEKDKALAAKIGASAEKLRQLAISLQNFLRQDNGQVRAPVDLNSVLRAAINSVAISRDFNDFYLDVTDLPQLPGYSTQLELMFFHLADNAIKFRDPSRRLRIIIDAVKIEENIFRTVGDRYQYIEYLKISFTDNGLGIPEKYRHYIFELLKKIDVTSSGLGLGLPLVKRIVSNHEGSISVVSRAKNGTTFNILLPTA